MPQGEAGERLFRNFYTILYLIIIVKSIIIFKNEKRLNNSQEIDAPRARRGTGPNMAFPRRTAYEGRTTKNNSCGYFFVNSLPELSEQVHLGLVN
jgi:hypothetical protein